MESFHPAISVQLARTVSHQVFVDADGIPAHGAGGNEQDAGYATERRHWIGQEWRIGNIHPDVLDGGASTPR